MCFAHWSFTWMFDLHRTERRLCRVCFHISHLLKFLCARPKPGSKAASYKQDFLTWQSLEINGGPMYDL